MKGSEYNYLIIRSEYDNCVDNNKFYDKARLAYIVDLAPGNRECSSTVNEYNNQFSKSTERFDHRGEVLRIDTTIVKMDYFKFMVRMPF
jgi:hypothetical protein